MLKIKNESPAEKSWLSKKNRSKESVRGLSGLSQDLFRSTHTAKANPGAVISRSTRVTQHLNKTG